MFGLRRPMGLPAAILLAGALLLGLSCRKELPELFDRNQPPETYITAAPVESLFDGFRVHVSWFGRDPDGEIAYYLWAWTDSSEAYFAAWNPENRLQDRILREGAFNATHLTTRSDSVFYVLANDEGGTSRDLTFNITAVDDKGRRDPVPARLYFSASVDSRPEIIWLDEPPETLSVGESFSASFTGTTQNEALLGFQWSFGQIPSYFPLNLGGDPIWTYQIQCGQAPNVPPKYCIFEDAQSVTLDFANDPLSTDPEFPGEFWRGFYQFGTFFIKAKCVDVAGVESEVDVDPGQLKGALAPVLNRDPDTRLRPVEGDDFPLAVAYRPLGSQDPVTYIPSVRLLTTADDPDLVPGFHYVVEDTLPWGEDTWLTVNLQGWDLDDPLIDAQVEEIETRFQMDYAWRTPNLDRPEVLEINGSSPGKYPPSNSPQALGFPEDIDLSFPHWGDAGQHYKMNLLPVNYVVQGYALDHYKRSDGTPCTVQFVAGFAASVDSVVLSSAGENVFGNVEILNRSEPVSIELVVYPDGPPPDVIRFLWDEAGNTAKVAQIADEVSPDDGVRSVEFDLQFKVYGHDDERNGETAQLGRIRWDLLDSDYDDSITQFNDLFRIDQGAFVKVWEGVAPPEELPGTSGVYTINLRIKERYDTVLAAGDPPPRLGEKEFKARFCNTVLADNFRQLIEDVSQGQFQMTSVGRMSPERGKIFSIRYGGGPGGP